MKLLCKPPVRRVAAALAIAGLLAAPLAQAHHDNPSAASSALSLLPVAVVVVAPVALLSAGVALTVVAVEGSAVGTVWVLERGSDGSRASVRVSGDTAVGVGTVVSCTVIGSGVVLSAAGQAIAFIPNEIGRALLHNERVTR